MTGTGAQAVIAALQRLAVERVFGIPGIQTLELFDGLADAAFETILTTDERSAAYMADAHARVTGKVGMLVVTPGPGLTNALTGLAEARLDSSPVVVIAAAISSDLHRKFQLHAMNQTAILAPIVKAVYSASSVEEIPRLLVTGAREAEDGEPGPVVVEIPYDLFTAQSDWTIPDKQDRAVPAVDEEKLDRIANELKQSPSIGIYVGRGAAQAADELQRLAELLHAPVATTMSGRGVLAEDHPLSVGFGFGPCGQPIAERLFHRVHTLLAIGCKYTEPATGSFGMRMPPRHIHIDINASSIGANYHADFALVADAKPALEGLLSRLQSRPQPPDAALTDRILRSRLRHTGRVKRSRLQGDAVSPARFLRALRLETQRDTIFVTDSGSHQFWALAELPIYSPNTFLVPADFQAMGFSIPAAIAAQLARPHQRVISLVGDGGFLLSAMELATVGRLGLRLMVVVFQDGALGLIREAQQRVYRRTPFTGLSNPDFALIAKAFGMEHIAIGCDEEIKHGVAQAVRCNRSVLVEVKVRYNVPSQYFQGTGRATFGHLPWDRKARIVLRRIWRSLYPPQ
jgi:acetolactate synthase I/II/III large subunit